MAVPFFYSQIRNFTVVPKRSFDFLKKNAKFYSCPQIAICLSTAKYKVLKTASHACTPTANHFFTAKYGILQLYRNSQSIFYNEIRNFTVVPKRPFLFRQWNTKFYYSHQKPICSLTAIYEIWSFTQTVIGFFNYKEEKWNLINSF